MSEKTELAKALAEVLFDDESASSVLDMSEYMGNLAASRLNGAPSRLCGLRRSMKLTEKVLQQTIFRSLILRGGKAHPDIFNVLLQVLDDGVLNRYSKGRKMDFSNTIIIMTSNLGATFFDDSDSWLGAKDIRFDQAEYGKTHV